MTRSIRGLAFATLVAALGLGCGPKPDAGTPTASPPATGGQPGAPAQPTAKGDAELILGTWKCESATVGGKPEEALTATAVLIFTPKKATLKGPSGGEPAPYKLDPTKTPKAIDIDLPGGGDSMAAIYELNGDHLKLCLAPPKDARPTAFESKEGQKTILLTFKRDKDAPPAVDAKVFDEKDYPTAIVGKWKGVSGETRFGTMLGETEFTKEGKVLRLEGGKWNESGKYKFEKNELVITPTGKDENKFPDSRYKITSISDDELVSGSPSGKLKRQK